MIDSYEKYLAVEYCLLFVADLLIVTLAYAGIRRLSDRLSLWALANLIGLVGLFFLTGFMPAGLQVLYLGGITRFGVLTIALLVFSTRFASRFLQRRFNEGLGKLSGAAIRSIIILSAFFLGYGLIQLETDKASGRRRLADYWANVRLSMMMNTDPATMPVIKAFQTNFPAEAGQVLDQFVSDTVRQRPSPNAPIIFKPGDLLDRVRKFLVSQSGHIAGSDDDHLVAVFAAQKTVIEGFQRFPALCAIIADGDKAALGRLNDPGLARPADRATLDRNSRLLIALLDAAGDGQRHSRKRDFARLPRKLARVLASLPPRQRQIANGLISGTDAEVCQTAIGLNNLVMRLPQEDVALWTAHLATLRTQAKPEPHGPENPAPL